MESLTQAQRETLTLWAERTEPGRFYSPYDVFSNRDNVDNARRRTMAILAGQGVVKADPQGRMEGGNPFAMLQEPAPRKGDETTAHSAVARNRPSAAPPRQAPPTRPAPPRRPPPRPTAPPPPHADLAPWDEPPPWDDPAPSPPVSGRPAGEGERPDNPRMYSLVLKAAFLHVEDCLSIGKVKLFAGQYTRGQGASQTVVHYMDAPDMRSLCYALAHGEVLDYTEFKGTASGNGGPVSRVLKVKRNGDGKTWLRLENGPGAVIGEGAVKPAGEPTAFVNIGLDPWAARRLALTVQAYMDAWQTAALLRAGE